MEIKSLYDYVTYLMKEQNISTMRQLTTLMNVSPNIGMRIKNGHGMSELTHKRLAKVLMPDDEIHFVNIAAALKDKHVVNINNKKEVTFL